MNFLASSEGFQKASGFRYGRSTTPRLDGAIFAASNAGGWVFVLAMQVWVQVQTMRVRIGGLVVAERVD